MAQAMGYQGIWVARYAKNKFENLKKSEKI
jgi:hypothetical protein